ncbi:MAG: glycosyltransferase involved in cell wall biosynthesis [Alteromonadaceae bacterium]|jgi:glycosyltransferase involved in cell wall biosynthesis
MKKILYIVSTLKKTGPTNQLSYILKYLDRTRFSPIILTLSPEPEDSMKEYFENVLMVSIYSLHLSRLTGSVLAHYKINQFIEEHSIDVLHSQGLRADSLIASIKRPKVSTLRNYPFYDYPSKFGKIKGTIMAYSHLRSIKQNAKNCIACSKSISNEFRNNKLRLPFIQNGVDLSIYSALTITDKVILKERMNLPLNKKLFITVGSLIPRKNVETLIKAFNIYNKNEESLLIIVGDGFERGSLELNANQHIDFVGNQPNVVKYLQCSDVFVSASLAEGLPNTVLEAMACDLPVVLSNIPSHLELFEGEGEFFFAPKSHIELASKLKNLDDIEGRKRSNEMINRNFSAESMSKKYQQVYMEKISE